MSSEIKQSPAGKVMDEAIELAIEGRSPYPERALFIDADELDADWLLEDSVEKGMSVVVVSADGTTEVLSPEEAAAKLRA
jgi:hypothetical protein